MQFAASHLIDLLERSGDAVVIASPDLTVIFANQAAQIFFGDALALPVPDILARAHPPDTAARITQHAIPLAIREGVWQAETPVRTLDGRDLLVRQSIVSHRDESGQLLYLAIIMRDLTEDRFIREKLQAATDRFESLAANVPGAIFQYGMRPDGSDWVEYMSPGCLSIWEVSAEAIRESPALLWEMIDPADLPAMQKSVLDSGARLTPWQHLWRIHTASGRTKWVEGHGQPIRLADGSTLWNSLLLDVTDRKNAEALIEQLVNYDHLTGLLNRRGFDAAFQQIETRAAQARHPFGLLFVDLDNFKYLNDTLGHERGDDALIEISRRLQQTVGNADLVARLGGDEFVVLVSAEDADSMSAELTALACRLLSAVKAPIALEQHQFTLTCSIGIAMFDPAMSDEQPDLLRWADLAMYNAKLEGRDQFRFFDAQLQKRMNTQVELEQELRQAVAQLRQPTNPRPLLWLAFQPIVAADNQTLGYEALLRWTRSTGEAVPPAEFIPISEQSGLICDLGDWVLEEVCSILGRWQATSTFCQRQISVNISPIQIKQSHFTRRMGELLALYRVPAHRLKLELTETVMQHDMEDVAAKLYELRDMGVEISLDDFGTGYSSLSYLHRLPFHELKIDRSFADTELSPPSQDNPQASVASLIVQLGQALNLRVVAEGVETKGQLAWLENMGCKRFQGFYFGHPACLAEIEAAG